MRENTPPRMPDIEDEIEEIINLENDIPPAFMDEDLDMDVVEDATDDEEQDTPVQDDALITIRLHSNSVFSCDFHPNEDYCITGDEENKVFIWERTSGKVLQEFTEHEDTVIEVRFNHDGNYLATADMAGVIYIYKLQSTENKERDYWHHIWDLAIGDLLWMHWHHLANVLFAGTEAGAICIIRVPSGEYKTLPSSGRRCVSGDLCADGKTYFASYDDGTVKLWDIKSATTLMVMDANSPMKHVDGETRVACHKQAPFYMSGGVEGRIVFFTSNGPVGVVEAKGAVECLAFSPSSDNRMAASGTLEGQLAIWDPSKLALRTTCDHPEKEDITKLQWASEFTLIAATTEGNIYGYDARTGTRIFQLSGHRSFIYTFSYDKHKRQILTASDDHTAKIFQVPDLAI